MTVVILILVAIFLLGLGYGAGAWFILRRRLVIKGKEPIKQASVGKPLPFRWSYIILPLAILFLSIILSAYFYHLLPAEAAYHFKLDGTPDRWLSREIIMVWGLTLQFLVVLIAVAIVWGVTKLGILFRQTESTVIKPERILLLMGNMVALLQIVLCFAMVDIFSYNSYQAHLMPMWLFLLIILGLATISLGLLLAFIFLKAKRQLISQLRD